MASLTFEHIDKTITVLSPGVAVGVQELVDKIAGYMDEPSQLSIDVIADWEGKAGLGGSEFTGITLTLINDWRVQFEARGGPTYISCQVTGGNLVAINAFSDNPIKPTAFTQVQIRQSQAPTIINAGVEEFWDALRSAHTVGGSFGEGVLIATSGIQAASFAPGAIDAAAIASGAIDADAIAVAAITSAKFAVGAIDALAVATGAWEEAADVLLDRDMDVGTDSGTEAIRTVRQALAYLRNRRRFFGGSLQVYKGDDTSVSWSGPVTTAVGNPVTEINPADA